MDQRVIATVRTPSKSLDKVTLLDAVFAGFARLPADPANTCPHRFISAD